MMCVLSMFAFAQDLDTTTISDQYDTGVSRGNASGSLTYGAPAVDGSEYLDYTGSDAVGTIRYINGFATDPNIIESPIVDCTVPQDNLDRSLTGNIPAISPNNRPGATDGSHCILIGDDGGWNGIFFGESDDSNYYVQVDVYCYDRSSLPADNFESVYLVARAARDNDPNMTDYSFNMDRAGSYSVVYDPVLRTVMAVKWTTGNTFQDIETRVASTYTEFGHLDNITEGWHTFRIECYGTKIRFYFDDTKLADVVDGEFANGRPGFGYREYNVTNSDERQGHFDNMQAGPFTIPPPAAAGGTWTLYE